MRGMVFSLLLTALAACAGERVLDSGGQSGEPFALPPPPAFPVLGAALPAGHTAYGNESLARLFVVLAGGFEWGMERPNLVRFEEPVRVALEGRPAAAFEPFLDHYLARIRAEAGLDIAPAERVGEANLHVRFVNGREFRRLVQSAACITTVGDLPWLRFAADPQRFGVQALVSATTLEAATVFIPDDAPPHLVRSCLLEEIPQALGLGNDLFGLASSSFNDDGAHLWPTKLDYLMLRLLYSPGMDTGLSLREARLRARALLTHLNPAGESAPPLSELNLRALGDWADLMRAVFSRRAKPGQRERFIVKALTLVQAQAPDSPQHCHTLITAGRVFSRPDPARALSYLTTAKKVCERATGVSDIRQARIALEMSCVHLRLGRPEKALRLVEEAWPVLAAHGQDERLAALFTIGVEARTLLAPGSPETASMMKLARAWSDYAMGQGRRAADCRARGS